MGLPRASGRPYGSSPRACSNLSVRILQPSPPPRRRPSQPVAPLVVHCRSCRLYKRRGRSALPTPNVAPSLPAAAARRAAVPPLRCYPRCRSPRAALRRRSRTLRTLRTLRTAAHNAGRADAAAADAPESAPVSRVSTWHEASVVRCRPWRGWGSGTPCHDEEAVAAVVEELPRHLRHSGVRSRVSLHSWRANRCSWPISCQCDAGTGRAAARRAAQSRRSFPVQQRTKIPVQQRTICEDRAALAAGGLCGTCRAAMA